MVKEEIVFDSDNEFHMLRHFEVPDKLTIERILNQGYTQFDIEKEISYPGSRFYSLFASSISELLSIIFNFQFNISKGINDNLVLEFDIPISNFPKGIGSNAVVNKNNLTNNDIQKIYYETNRGYKLFHLDVFELPKTNLATVIIKDQNGKYIFITAFPGYSAMPVPDNKMPKQLFAKCKNYWDEHVFLNLGHKK